MSKTQIERKIMRICAEQNLDYTSIQKNIVIEDSYRITIEKIKEDCRKNEFKVAQKYLC